MKTKRKSNAVLIVSLLFAAVRILSAQQQTINFSTTIPEFIYTVRAYGDDRDDFEFNSMKELGLKYFHHHWQLSWWYIETSDNTWSWVKADTVMAKIARNGLKIIPHIQAHNSIGLPWDSTITRFNPIFAEKYGRFAGQLVRRYSKNPAWSGIVSVWGGSSDIWTDEFPHTQPDVVVRLLNAVYDSVKRADSNTIVIGLNMGEHYDSSKNDVEWEDWHSRAFALSPKPKFDWFGVQTTHNILVTTMRTPQSYYGIFGLTNIRRFLDSHGYTKTPIWLNEGGFTYREFGEADSIGFFPPDIHAEQVVGNFIVSRILNVNLKGWVYFNYFREHHVFEDFDWGLMSALDQHDPPLPRPAWYALQTLIKKVQFFDYQFDAKLSGEFNELTPPFVLRFAHRDSPSSKLWIVFSPRAKGEPISQPVTINISPSTSVVKIDMLGTDSTIMADASGNITINSTTSPVYLRTAPLTGEIDISSIPSSVELFPVYPNPFNPLTNIRYQLNQNGFVTMKIYDVLGRDVKTLVNEFQAAGSYTIRWDGKSNYNVDVNSGVYLSKLTFQSDKGIEQLRTSKMTLIK